MTSDTVAMARRTQLERTTESTERLVAAAIELIAEKGFSNTSAAEIGERAGYSRSMVQFRWGSKEALLESLLRDEYETRLLPPPTTPATGLDRVLGQVDQLAHETAEHPALMRGFYALCFEAIGPLPSLRTWITDWLARYEAETAAALTAGQADGTISPAIDPATEAAAFVAAGLGYAFRWMVAPDSVDFAAAMTAWRTKLCNTLAARDTNAQS